MTEIDRQNRAADASGNGLKTERNTYPDGKNRDALNSTGKPVENPKTASPDDEDEIGKQILEFRRRMQILQQRDCTSEEEISTGNTYESAVKSFTEWDSDSIPEWKAENLPEAEPDVIYEAEPEDCSSEDRSSLKTDRFTEIKPKVIFEMQPDEMPAMQPDEMPAMKPDETPAMKPDEISGIAQSASEQDLFDAESEVSETFPPEQQGEGPDDTEQDYTDRVHAMEASIRNLRSRIKEQEDACRKLQEEKNQADLRLNELQEKQEKSQSELSQKFHDENAQAYQNVQSIIRKSEIEKTQLSRSIDTLKKMVILSVFIGAAGLASTVVIIFHILGFF